MNAINIIIIIYKFYFNYDDIIRYTKRIFLGSEIAKFKFYCILYANVKNKWMFRKCGILNILIHCFNHIVQLYS